MDLETTFLYLRLSSADDNQGDAFDRLEGITRTDHPNPKANAYKGYNYADDEKTSVIQQELGNHYLVTTSATSTLEGIVRRFSYAVCDHAAPILRTTLDTRYRDGTV